MAAAAERLDRAAELLAAYAKECFGEALNGPGVDSVSVQATRVLRGQLNSERLVVDQLVTTFRQHAADIRKQSAASQQTDSELDSGFRGELL